MEDSEREGVRESRAQTGGNGMLVFFKVEPSQSLNPQRCLPGLILPRPLGTTAPFRASLQTSWSICLHRSFSSPCKLSPLQGSVSLLSYNPLCLGGCRREEKLHSFIHFLSQWHWAVLWRLQLWLAESSLSTLPCTAVPLFPCFFLFVSQQPGCLSISVVVYFCGSFSVQVSVFKLFVSVTHCSQTVFLCGVSLEAHGQFLTQECHWQDKIFIF